MLKDSGRAHLIILIFANILVWASFLSVIFFTDPAGAGVLGVMTLYVSFGIGLGGLGFILWQLIKRKKN